MKTSILLGSFAIIALLAQSAFAQNLGNLTPNQQPKDLISANEFANNLHTSLHEVAISNPALRSGVDESDPGNTDRDNSGNGYRNNDRGYGYSGNNSYDPNYYYPNYYYPTYYYPYYSYPSYSYPYYRDRGRRYYSNENRDNLSDSALDHLQDHLQLSGKQLRSATDLTKSNVVCFASDSRGNWFANADVSQNAITAQEVANHECLGSGTSCNQNLGCALATHPSVGQ